MFFPWNLNISGLMFLTSILSTFCGSTTCALNVYGFLIFFCLGLGISKDIGDGLVFASSGYSSGWYTNGGGGGILLFGISCGTT